HSLFQLRISAKEKSECEKAKKTGRDNRPARSISRYPFQYANTAKGGSIRIQDPGGAGGLRFRSPKQIQTKDNAGILSGNGARQGLKMGRTVIYVSSCYSHIKPMA
ncbi:MAG: hypothetical protein ACTSP0_01820, partial [Alphaproteobacteria bacterium]